MTDIFCLRTGTLDTAKTRIMLTPADAAILGHLRKIQPDIASKQDLSQAVWGPEEQWPPGWFETIEAHLAHLRKAMLKGGAESKIRNHYAFGWHLEGTLEWVE
jgi:DNA-binding winged helix-turn-helix (wHTH) protein